MKLTSIELDNYRNLSNLKIDLNPDLNFIVGENNIGKSNFLHALNIIFSGKWFEEQDFARQEEPIEINLTFTISDDEIGIFGDLAAPLTPNRINIVLTQASPEDRLSAAHFESGDSIPMADVRRLIAINYDSLRNPKNELDFNKSKGAGAFLHYLIKSYILENSDQIYLNKKAVAKLEKYTANILGKISSFGRFGISAKADPNFEELLSKIMILQDSNDINIDSIGYGAQYSALIVLSILERIISYARRAKAADKAVVEALLIFDEPEIHLHPYLQRTLLKDIIKIARGEDIKFNEILGEMFGIKRFEGQVIIATHSPNILNDDYQNIIRMYVENGITKVVNAKNIELDNSSKKHLSIQYMYIKEAMFARQVIIVEGDSEYGAFPGFASKMGINLDEFGIAIIKANGAESIIPLMRLFNGLHIKPYGVMDKDKKIEKQLPNMPNLFFTTRQCFDIELVGWMVKHSHFNTVRLIEEQYDSQGSRRRLQKKKLEGMAKKFSIKVPVISDIRLCDVDDNDPVFELVYATWFSINKGILLGRLIGETVTKEQVPACYRKVFNALKRELR